jgi:hypothetical protein
VPLNRLEIFAEKLSHVLDPGERALFLGTAVYVVGDEQLGPDRPRFDVDLSDVMLGVPTPYVQSKINDFMLGRSLVGDPGCQAESLARILIGPRDLLVSDRRLLALDSTNFRPLWEAPRKDVLAAAPAPRIGQAGRVRIVLGDGSALAVVLGMVLPGRARRFLDALKPVAGELR